MTPISFWHNKRVLVTGGTGFIGSHLVEKLLDYGAKVTVPTSSKTKAPKFLSGVISHVSLEHANLMDEHDALKVCKHQDVVMHLAARVGGLEYNIENPASIFYENVQLFLNVLEASRLSEVERFLVTSSACVYPRFCTIPTPEEEGFKDMPEPTNEGYGFAKRVEEFLGQKYHDQYGIKVALARPYNAYGPRDNFAINSSHVVPALIRKVVEAPAGSTIEVWGNGKQTRACLYVEDFARGLMEITEKYPVGDVLNIGTNEETRISDLVHLIIKLSRKQLFVHFDEAKPTGQPRRNCDTRKAKEKRGFEAAVPLEQGIQRTLSWYVEHKAEL